MLPAINYDQLKVVNQSTGVDSLEGKNDKFIEKFRSIFVKPQKPKPGIPNRSTKSFESAHAHIGRPRSRFAVKRDRTSTQIVRDPPTIYDNPLAHDIRLHVSRIRKHGDSKSAQLAGDDLVLNRERNLATLRNLVKKLPFERTRKEHKAVYKALKDLWPSELASILDDSKQRYPVLKELATVAMIDNISEAGMTVFGNTGLHMILKGTVFPQTIPYLRKVLSVDHNDDAGDFACPTPLLRHRHIKLHEGDWFGSLVKLEDREINSKVLSAVTTEPCQFLKISTADYKRILHKVHQRIENEKMAVVQACPFYKNWPGLSVRKLATLIEWKNIAADSVVVAEGDIAPFVAFIRSGDCDVFKQVEALRTLPNGKQMRVYKSVLLGKLGPGDSIGEDSILERKAISCSVVSHTDLELGVITPDRLQLLDVTTRTLLSQTVGPRFADISEDEIQANFVKQEMKDDWDRMRRRFLIETMNYCGIRPGYGKWTHGKKSPLC